MLTQIPDVLSASELKAIMNALADSEFVDGRETAGKRAKRVKRNAQLRNRTEQERSLGDVIVKALGRSSIFRMAAVPKRVHRPLFSRYRKGMHYGRHLDDALMDRPNALRTDVSVTVFLNEPDCYEGGELLMHSPYGEVEIKLPAGHVVVYPSTTLHQVNEVTQGERLVAVTWAESHVREAEKREILFDLDAIKTALNGKLPDSTETELVFKTYSNLLRLWAQT